jgi:hypothetical protein
VFASICGAAIFFMLAFLRALLREAATPPIGLIEKLVSIQHGSMHLDRPASSRVFETDPYPSSAA